MGEPAEPVPPSGYMTLIPLNGETCSAVLDVANSGVIFHCMFCCPMGLVLACCSAPDDDVTACCRREAEASEEAALLQLHGKRPRPS